MIRRKSLILGILCFSVYSQGSALQYAQYKIEGYRKQISGPGKQIVAQAQSAEGLGDVGFEDLTQARITVTENKFYLIISGGEAMFKPDHIILVGHAKLLFSRTPKGKNIFTVESQLPDDEISVDLVKDEIKVPAAIMKWKGRSKTGRSLVIDLAAHNFLWVQPQKKGGLKSPPQPIPFGGTW